jgi:hypothetical protein
MISMYKKSGIIFFVVTFSTLLIGFLFNEDVSGGGTSGDFYYTLNYVIELKENISAVSEVTVHLPLHYIILSRIDYFINNETILRFLFLIISILVPFLFYLCLKIKFKSLSSNDALIISSLIFLFPSFRYSAIWANAHITALIFFLLSSYFFLKIKIFSNLNINIYLNLFFLSLATYSRQYYALFFLYYLYFYYKNFKPLNFIYIVFYIFLLSAPGWILIYNNPQFLLGGSGSPMFSFKLYNSLLIISSIVLTYFIPLIFIILFKNKNFLLKNSSFLIISALISISIVLISSIFFDYNFKIGGGIFAKASRYLFSNNLLFYLSSIFGFIIIFYIAREHRDNFLILSIILFGFSGTYVLQKYFEPMFFMILYLYIKTNFYKYLLNMKFIFISYLYYFFYYIATLVNSFYKFSTSV